LHSARICSGFFRNQAETVARSGIREICTARNRRAKTANNREIPEINLRNPYVAVCFQAKLREQCTKSGHRLVDGLHSIENTHFADAGF
jgi:hypothetical protein